jgi:hypothetical protein
MATSDRLILHDSTRYTGLPYNAENGYESPSIYIEGNAAPGHSNAQNLAADNWEMMQHHYLEGSLDLSWRRTTRLVQGVFPVQEHPPTDEAIAHRLMNVGAHSRVDCEGI